MNRSFRQRIPLLVLAFLTVGSLFLGRSTADDDKKILDGPRIKKLVKTIYMAQDDAGLQDLLKRLARVNSRVPVRALLDSAQKFGQSEVTEDWYYAIIEGVGSFNRPLAYTEIANFVIQYKSRPISRDLLHALHKNRSKYMNRVFRRVLQEGSLDLRLMAVDMAAVVPFRRTVDVLLAAYSREEANPTHGSYRQRLVLALEGLTRQRMGDSYPNWIGWWEVNRHRGLMVIRREAEADGGATGVVRRMDPVRERQFLGLEDLPEGKVLVIEGPTARNGVNTNNDDISSVLTRLHIPHDKVLKERLDERSYKINQYAAILINCTQIHEFCQSPGHRGGNAVGNRLRRCLGPDPHDVVQFKMGQVALKKIKKWVKAGGYLFTEDWVLVEVVSENWPKLVSVGKKLSTSQVDIRAARGQGTHPLVRGVFVPPPDLDLLDWDPGDPFDDEEDKADELDKDYDPKSEDDPGDNDDGGSGRTGVDPAEESEEEEEFEDPIFDSVKHEWKIDNESNAIDVRSRKVSVLIDSKKLKAAAGKSNAVAIDFGHGKGRVLHVLSHFGKQQSSHDTATIENLLINYLLEVQVRIKR